MIRVCGGGGHRELIKAILHLAQDSRWILRDTNRKKNRMKYCNVSAHERLVLRIVTDMIDYMFDNAIRMILPQMGTLKIFDRGV